MVGTNNCVRVALKLENVEAGGSSSFSYLFVVFHPLDPTLFAVLGLNSGGFNLVCSLNSPPPAREHQRTNSALAPILLYVPLQSGSSRDANFCDQIGSKKTPASWTVLHCTPRKIGSRSKHLPSWAPCRRPHRIDQKALRVLPNTAWQLGTSQVGVPYCTIHSSHLVSSRIASHGTHQLVPVATLEIGFSRWGTFLSTLERYFTLEYSTQNKNLRVWDAKTGAELSGSHKSGHRPDSSCNM